MTPGHGTGDAWQSDYSTRGRLWGGNPSPLPPLSPGTRVLELGCGNGRNLPGMQSRGWDFTGADHAPEALRLSREAVKGNPGVALVVADARHLPFRAASFDAVCAFHVTGHLDNEGRHSLAREVYHVLKDGGEVFVREFGDSDFRFGKGKEVEEHSFRRGTGTLTHYFSTDELRDLFGEFTVVSTGEERWSMRVRGRDYPRCEIVATFRKGNG